MRMRVELRAIGMPMARPMIKRGRDPRRTSHSNLRGLRAEGETDSQFPGAAGYRVGKQAVDSDTGEEKDDESEKAGEAMSDCVAMD